MEIINMENISGKITLLIKSNNQDLTDLQLKKIEFGLTTMISELSKTLAFLLLENLKKTLQEVIS